MTTFESAAALRAHYNGIRAKFFPYKPPTFLRQIQPEPPVLVIKKARKDEAAIVIDLPAYPPAIINPEMTADQSDQCIISIFAKLVGLRPAVSLGRVQHEVAALARVRVQDLMGPARTPEFIIPRHMAMFLCRLLTTHSFPRIGHSFGGRDHTTVINACRKYTHLMYLRPDLEQPETDGQAFALSA